MLPPIPEAAVWAIFFLPLLSFLWIATGFPWPIYGYPRATGWVTIGAVALSFLLSLWALDSVMQSGGRDLGFPNHGWIAFANFVFPIGLTVDGLTGLMLVVVTGVSLLVQVYSQGYMAGDTGYSRYYTYMSLFTASMLGLVLARNLLMLFVFWELVGLCSYLLIGFWFHRPAAAAAAKKAFLVTRLGDLGFLAAILLIWNQTGPANTLLIPEIVEFARIGALSSTVLTWFTLGIFAGAAGKSAQFPLHVWLPDAMEGPTPVSALIHAATMVAAGVYLVARLFPVFDASPQTLRLVGVIGGITALGAATMGIVMTDIKRVLAYSTISQLGYMMLALGVGGVAAGVFHLFTHAFFKALLFLGAGSVNHATNTFDMRRMGGLARAMPITFGTFAVAALSLAGIFPLAGFWSKDEILLDAWHESKGLFWVALITAGLTAFYMGRVIFLTFLGEYKGGEPAETSPTRAAHGGVHAATAVPRPHESPWTMTGPLLVLAVPAVIAGFANINGGVTHLLAGTLPEGMQLAQAEFSLGIALASTVVALGGLAVAAAIYYWRVITSESLLRSLGPVHAVVVNKYYLDDLYEKVIVNLLFYQGVARLLALFDDRIIDGAVNGVASLTRAVGAGLRRAQTGQLQAYGAVFFAGVIIILGVIFLAGRI